MTESTSVKGCINCIHYDDNDLFPLCKHPDYSYKTKDYIRGDVYTNHSLCVLVREDEKRCGDSARGWEENPLKKPEYYPSIWEAFKGFFR